MGRLLGVQISEETVRRLTEQMGSALEQAQTQEAQAPFQEAGATVCIPEKRAFSADGAMVGLVHGEWAEVRTLVIGEVKEQTSAKKKRCKQEPRVVDVSSFSRLVDAETFCQLAEVEMRRRHVLEAKEVCAVMDGADWLQEFIDVHREDATRILDFPHAAEHVTCLLEALVKAGYTFPAQMLERSLSILKQRGPSFLLSRIDRLPSSLLQQNGIREHVGYLRKREALMQYPTFLKRGLPIGSGMVESANKLVVEARLKGAGMRWERKNVNKMLPLRNGVCNDRWQATWQEAGAAVRQQQKQQRERRRKQREEAKLLTCDPRLLESPPLPPKAEPAPPRLPAAPPATLPGSSRPSAHHPWKRSFLPS
ncbi:hypothetical protein KDI_55980 [Dictyobacter arantiisoli]|uniref:Uncharacterized protein n=2 Tax=Dictyobacter arantiisoli TaxID=2014874 RepID=A0A5A5TLS1_9CHLR|nr:hypothetical protein KDI_55980 [Dictyobacter arantiisoli]